MAKTIRLVLLIAIVLAVLAVIVWSFVPRPVPVDVAPVAVAAFEATVDVDGVTRVKESYVVSAPYAGSLHRIELHAGGAVESGAVVARMSPTEPPLLDARTAARARASLAAARAGHAQAQAAVERARLATEFSDRELARTGELGRRGAVTAHVVEEAALESATRRRELEATQFAARVAAHEVELAEAAVARLRPDRREEVSELRSPVGGRVLRVLREDEGVVAAGTPLVEIADLTRLEVVADVATADAAAIRPGAAVTLTAWGGGDALRGHVRLVEPAAFTKLSALGIEEQRVNVVIDLDEPGERYAALGDGFRVEVHIVVWQGPDVVQVPASALFRADGAWSVFVWEDGRARLRAVEPGRQSGTRAQVMAGLAAGDTVIVHPGDAVANGVRVARRAR